MSSTNWCTDSCSGGLHGRPTFGFKGWYAYAAPGCYLSRTQFLVVGSAPLLLLTVLGSALELVIPETWVFWVLAGLIGNAVAAIGDMYLIGRLVLVPSAVVIENQGEGIPWYGPAKRLAPLKERE